jgi:leucyl-tRNA synthetase
MENKTPNFFEIDQKQQKKWDEAKLFKTPEKPKPDKKFYCLDMFPYPSGQGLHVGHPEGYTASDIICRYKRMRGYDVLHPMGWDAFGLPAENYAIETGIHPKITVKNNIENFKRQIKSIGFSYDWDREINTTDEHYYKWTQWIFLRLFNKGLAYENNVPINWCPSCKTGLANEEVFQGKCERCGSETQQKKMKQWMLKITAYADRLLDDLEGLDWPHSTLLMQKNWIGKSRGAEIDFKLDGLNESLRIFTTRPDTIYGVTYLTLAPEHELVKKLTTKEHKTEVEKYVSEANKKTDFERANLEKNKTGVFTGSYAINPITNGKIPIWISDYVIMGYGTGAIMAVPAHDEHDWDFAKKFGLDIIQVVKPENGDCDKDKVFTEYGTAINSPLIDGLKTPDALEKMITHLEKNKIGKAKTNYKLRDWVFSRQRYWGEPIPIIHCEKCGPVGVPENELPLTLPETKSFKPTDSGQSPLAAIEEWKKTKCPKCKGPAVRETNTMPQWAGSCWYYLRFIDSKNSKTFCDKNLEKAWMPVDSYIGGSEHAVLHLLYARFWHKVLYDLGYVSTKEPFQKLRHQGMILAYSYRDESGVYHPYSEIDFSQEGKATLKGSGGELTSMVEKMSKSKKNVVNPDEIISEYGADAFRMYEMFMGPFDASKPWDMKGIEGVSRFLKRIWFFFGEPAQSEADDKDLEILRNKTIEKVSSDIENFGFNTAISAMMVYFNTLQKAGCKSKTHTETFLKLLHPFAPHISEELWTNIGNKDFIAKTSWPTFDKNLLKEEKLEIGVQVNGKVRGTISITPKMTQKEIEPLALACENVKKSLEGKNIVKIIVVPGRIVNIVVK